MGPRTRTKQAQIVAAAERLFMDQGFDGASMDAIAAAADVSKATLYAYFPSKEDLFEHVVTNAGQARVTTLDLSPEDLPGSLAQAAHEIMQLILAPRTVAMYRIIMSEGRHFPNLGTRFYTAGPAVLIDRLAAHFAAAMARGLLRKAPARVVAAQFIGLILGDLQVRVLLRLGKPPSKRERAAAADQGVEAFLRAYGP